MRALGRRVATGGRVVTPEPDRTVLAYARAVVAYGGGDPSGEGFGQAAIDLARWLGRGRWAPCGPG